MKLTAQEILRNIPIPPLYECGHALENKWYRLKTYYHLLEISQNTASAQETLDLINNKLVEVEDCHSTVLAEKNPGKKYNGRMYPIMEDMIDRRTDGRIIAMTKANKIIIESNGEFTILDRYDETPIFTKGHDN